MTSNIKLYIGDKLVEFNKQPDIFYNWTETDLSNPITTKNSFSKTITIEGTKTNNDIFGHYWNLERYQKYGGDTGTYFNPSYKVPFTLYINGNLFEKGYVKLEKITKTGNHLKYEVGLYGGLGSFLYNLSTNWVDGSVKTLGDLNYYDNNDELLDLDFEISRDTVSEAWNNIMNDNSKWSTINFGSFYTGIPDEIDTNKVLINVSGYPDIIKEEIVSGSSYTTYNGWSLGEMDNSLNQFEVKDLRSYLQTPLIRCKSIIDSLCKPINSKGQFDNGYEVVLDPDFFNINNPYYTNTFMTLPQIPTLNFSSSSGGGGTMYEVTGFTDVRNNEANAKYLNFELPQVISGVGGRVKLTLKPRVYVRYPGYDPEYTPPYHLTTLRLMKTYVGEELKWFGSNRHGYGVQVYAISDASPSTSINGQTVLTGSSVYWYTEGDITGFPFTFNQSGARPVVTNTEVKNVVGAWDYIRDITDIDPELELYGFNENTGGIVIETEVPAGTKQVRVWIKMFSEDGNDVNVIYQHGFRDSANRFTFNDISGNADDGEWYGNLEVTDFGGSGGTSESNIFYSYKTITQDMLLSTSYSVADWLMSYCKMFGLYIYKDKSEDKIYITTRNNFYDRDKVEDLTGLIDSSKGVTINPLYVDSKFISLTTPLEKTTYSEQYKNNYGVDYGMQKVDTGYDFNPEVKELIKTSFKGAVDCQKQSIYNFKSIEGINPYIFNGFKQTLYKNGEVYDDNTENPTIENEIPKKRIASVYKNYMYDSQNPYYDIVQHVCFENDEKPVSTENVLVFYNGMKNVTDAEYYLTDDMTVMSTLNNKPCWIMTKSAYNSGSEFCIPLYQIPVFSRYLISSSASTGTSRENFILQSLDFGSPREFYVPNIINNKRANLYYKYYEKYYSDLYDVNTKVLECYIKPNKILTEEDMRHFYWFKNGIWRLNKITDYNPLNNGLVKCQFIKVQDLANMTNEGPTSRIIINVVLDEYIIDNSGGTITGMVNVNDLGSWRVTGISGATGVSVTPSLGNGSRAITVTIPEYEEYGDRDIQIEFSTADDSQIVTITQIGVTGIEAAFYESEYSCSATQLTYYLYTASAATASLYKDGVLVDSMLFTGSSRYDNQIFNISANTTNSAITYVLSATTDNGEASCSDTVTQLAPDFYFVFNSTNTSAVTKNLTSVQQDVNEAYSTNISGLTVVSNDSWISNVSLDGTKVSYSVAKYENTSTDRTGSVSVMSGSTVVGTITVNQEKAPLYFIWLDTNTSATTSSVGSGATSTYKSFDTNYSALTVSYSDWVTSAGISNSTTTVNFPVNSAGQQARTSTVLIKYGSTTVGTFTISQQKGEDFYFRWNTTNTSAVTESVSSAVTSSSKAYTTNYSALTVSYSDWISTASISNGTVSASYSVNSAGEPARSTTIEVKYGSTVVGTFVINQSKGEDFYFKWVDTNTSATTSSVGSAVTYSTKECSTNMTAFTFTYDGLVTGGSINAANSYVTASFTTNPYDTTRTGSIYVVFKGSNVAKFTITQAVRQRYFYWNDSQSSVYSPSVNSASTSLTAAYTTDYDNVTFSGESGIISVVKNGSTSITATYSTNASADSRTMRVNAYSGVTQIGYISITQTGAGMQFKWNTTNTSALTATVGSASTYADYAFTTNLNSLTTTYSGFVTGATINGNKVELRYVANPNTSDRTGTVNVKHGNTIIGTINITQKAKRYFYWVENSSTAITANVASGASASVSKECATNITNFSFVNDGTVVTATSINAAHNYISAVAAKNAAMTTRTGRTDVYDADANEKVGKMDVTQAAAVYFFKWTATNTGSYLATVDSGTTSFKAVYTTDYPNGVTFSADTSAVTVTKNGSTAVTATFSTNPSADSRTMLVRVKYGENQVGYLEITQNAYGPYFRWTDTSTSAVTQTVGSGATSSSKTYTTNLPGLTVTYSGCVTSATINNGTVTAGYAANPNTTDRTGGVQVKYGNTVVGTYSITQKAKRYFYWVDTSTSAITGNVASGASSSVAKECRTNITNFAFTGDGTVITGGSINAAHTYVTAVAAKNAAMTTRTGLLNVKDSDANEVVGKMDITQAAAVYNFKWNASDSSQYLVTVNSASTSLQAAYTTDYPGGVTFSAETTAVSVTTGSTAITASYSTNPSADSRTMRVNVLYNNSQIGYLEITQTSAGIQFKWNENNSTAITQTVGSGATSSSKAYTTNLVGLTVSYSGCVTGATISNGTVTANYAANPNTTDRTGGVQVKYGNTVVGTYSITQNAQRYFYWNDTSSTAITGNVTSGASASVSKACTTNIANFSFTYDGTVVTGGSINAGHTSISAVAAKNTAMTTRSGELNVKDSDANVVVGKMSVSQAAASYYFTWNDSQTSVYRPTVTYTSTSLTAAYSTDYPSITFSAETTAVTFTKTSTSITANYSTNTSVDARTLRINAYYGSTQVGFIEITQSGKPRTFKWNENNSTAITQTVGSAVTSSSKAYTTDYTNLTVSYSGCVTSATISNGTVTANYTANPNTSARYGGVQVKSGSVVIGTYGITQQAKSVVSTRTIVINASQVPWYVNFTNRQVTIGINVSFGLTAANGSGSITGETYADYATTETCYMNGTITVETTTMSAFNLSLYLSVDGGEPHAEAIPEGNIYGFYSGEIGGGAGGYVSSGSVSVGAGSAGSTTTINLQSVNWEIANP